MKIWLTSLPNKQKTVPKDELENLKDPEVYECFQTEKKTLFFSDFDDVTNSDDVQVIIDLQLTIVWLQPQIGTSGRLAKAVLCLVAWIFPSLAYDNFCSSSQQC